MKQPEELLHTVYVKADRLMIVVVWGLFAISCLLAIRDYNLRAVLSVGLPTAAVASTLVYWRARTRDAPLPGCQPDDIRCVADSSGARPD